MNLTAKRYTREGVKARNVFYTKFFETCHSYIKINNKHPYYNFCYKIFKPKVFLFTNISLIFQSILLS